MKADIGKEDHPAYVYFWIGISAILIIVDYFSGPFIQFPITYLIPVALASWYNGKWFGAAFAVLLPLVRLYYNLELWTIPWTFVEAGLNCIIRITVFLAFALIIDRTAIQTRVLTKEVNMLEGLLPICSFCKKIRDDSSNWQPMEKYISERSDATFTHGLCPECAKKHYGHVYKKEK
jgi:hypothetical protein